MLSNILSIIFCTVMFSASAQNVTKINVDQLQTYIDSADQLLVVNFWATWCRPCVEELPIFEALKADNEDVDVLLVSLDFPKMLEQKVIPFVREHIQHSEVVLLDEKDPNIWIEALNLDWEGTIPATLIYNPERQKLFFYENQMDHDQLLKRVSRARGKS